MFFFVRSDILSLSFTISISIESSRHALICFSTDLLSSGRRELSKLDSMSTFCYANISSLLSSASRLRLMSRNSFSDFVSKRTGRFSSSSTMFILLSVSIWLAKSIMGRWTCRAPISTSADSRLKIEHIDWLRAESLSCGAGSSTCPVAGSAEAKLFLSTFYFWGTETNSCTELNYVAATSWTFNAFLPSSNSSILLSANYNLACNSVFSIISLSSWAFWLDIAPS